MTDPIPEPLAVDVQTGLGPTDTAHVVIVGAPGDRERAIAAVLDAHDVTVIDADVLIDEGHDPYLHFASSLVGCAIGMALSAPVFLDVPLVSITPKRKPTKAEWRRQMKGR